MRKLIIILLAVVPLTFFTSFGLKDAMSDQLKDLPPEEAIDCLARAIYFESKSEGFPGQLAVGMVVLNRTQDPRYPEDVCKVVYQGKLGTTQDAREQRVRVCQFSWACDGLSDKPKYPKLWANAVEVAHIVYSMYNAGYDITKGATHFHATHVNPAWRNDSNITRVGQIDRHIFYRWEL